MKRNAVELDPELESLLHFRTVARDLPDDVRARVLARSRAFLSGRSAKISRLAPLAAPTPPTISSSQRGGLRRLAIAAAIAILAGAAGAVAALRTRAADAPPAAFPERSGSFPVAVREETDLAPEPATTAPAPASNHHAMSSKPHPASKARVADKARAPDPLAEVELLQHAHLAYAQRDFRGALALVAEHARRFPAGPLAEECEALRVESLLAAGRALEARRAGASFAARFPRSVLLPGIEQTSGDESAP